MSTATKGRALEHEISRIFTEAGYAVIRGASSKGFFDSPEGRVKPDLIASKRGRTNKYEVQVILLQCKVRAK